MKNDKKLTRVELATRVQNLIHHASMAGVDEKYFDGLWDEVEQLKEPVTLAEFFGWEEGKEYWCLAERYSIVDDTLYRCIGEERRLRPAVVDLNKSFVEYMRNAKPVEDKKYYLINPEIKNDWDKYLNAGLDGGKIASITFRDKFSSTPFQAKLSKDEIETIKREYPKTFGICEVVEVEEES